MRRTGRVIVVFILILGCMFGMWVFQSWRDSKIRRDDKTLYNVYVTGISGSSIQVVCDGEDRSFETVSPVTGQAIGGIADLQLRQDKIIRIVKKPEEVKGKILKIKEQGIVLDGYGEVALDENFVVYRMDQSGNVKQAQSSELIVGAVNVSFVAVGQKLCAAVIPTGGTTNIRVILKNNDGSSYDMDKVVVTADVGYAVTRGDATVHYGKGHKLELAAGSVSESERLVVTADQGGRLTVESLKRTQGKPSYRGNLEIERAGQSLRIINELPLEEYLYSVVPSEMPTEYGEEALKAQAVCARSYAVQQMQGHRLATYGAHVDDSVSFQVYNNLKEDAKSVSAVNATANQVVAYQEKVATTYFYSTSCGCSAGTKDVWYTKKNIKYLTSELLTLPRTERDLSSEDEFVKFMNENTQTVDNNSPWYRWEAAISAKKLQKSLEKSIVARYGANPTQIQVRDANGNFASRSVATVGTVQNIVVKKRGKGGIVSMVEIEGSEETVRVYTEYNIRTLLIGENTKFTRQDKKEVTGLSILPSGFFYLEKKGDSFVFHGGGYGHGVGMSQNGANTLAAQGKGYGEILAFYFPGTSVRTIDQPAWQIMSNG